MDLSDGVGMSFSLNETAAMAKRATRGAGYPWGLAEEAAWAVRWLWAHGQDGTAALAALLRQEFGTNPESHRATRAGSDWRGDRSLCPLATGAALADFAQHLKSGEITLHVLAEPLLIVPFASAAARRNGTYVRVQSETANAVTDGSALELRGVFGPQAKVIRVSSGAMSLCPGKTRSRAAPAPADWSWLNRLAHRTYAPATEDSRRLGAGAGQTDND